MKTQRIWGTLDPFYEAGPILGRKVANIGFLNGLLQCDPFDEYHFFLSGIGAQKSLARFVETNFPALWIDEKIRIMDRRDLPEAIARSDYFCFHQSDCIVHPPHLARVRNKYSRTAFPITGTTHSLSYSNYGGPFLNYLWKGCTRRDCIVATSSPGRKVVLKYIEHLREGYDLDENKFPSPQIKQIPLGVDLNELPCPDAQEKQIARQHLQMDDGRVNILVFGRIAHYSKMDILPLLRAIQLLFAKGLERNKIRLIIAGWMDEEDDFPSTLQNLATNMGLELQIIGSPDERTKLDLYRAADIFVSISDNPQETFGLTILEAGAMGLPVIASEYDGYRDLIIDQQTGFLVETIGTPETPEIDVMAPLCFDNQYHLLIAQQTAVLTPQLAKALDKLINDQELRIELGCNGRKRVHENFTWHKVIRQHVQLWEELNQEPVDINALRDFRHPVQVRFGETFAHYTGSILSASTIVKTGTTGRAIYQGKDFPLIYSGLERVLNDEAIRKIPFFARKPLNAELLAEKICSLAPELTSRDAQVHILWCLKHDILEKVCPENQ